PLAWLAVARLKAEQERACNDRVLNHGVPAVNNAEHLLAVVSGLRAAAFLAPVSLAMSRASRMERRFQAILAEGRDRSSPSRRRLALTVAAGLGLLLLLAALGFEPRGAAAPVEAAEDEPPAQSDTEFAKKLAEARTKILESAVQKPSEKA